MSIFYIHNVYLSQLGVIIVFNVYLPVEPHESYFDKMQGFICYMQNLHQAEVCKLEENSVVLIVA